MLCGSKVDEWSMMRRRLLQCPVVGARVCRLCGYEWESYPNPKATFQYQCDRPPKRRLVAVRLVSSRGCSCPAGIREEKEEEEDYEKNGKEGCKEVEAFDLCKKDKHE